MIKDSINGRVVSREVTETFTISLNGEGLAGCSMAAFFKRDLSTPDANADIKKLSSNSTIALNVTDTAVTATITLNPADYASLPAQNEVKLDYAINLKTSANKVLAVSRGQITVKRSAMISYP